MNRIIYLLDDESSQRLINIALKHSELAKQFLQANPIRKEAIFFEIKELRKQRNKILGGAGHD